MANYTYYLLFSLTLLEGAVSLIAIMLYFRITGKTFLGQRFKPGTSEYEKYSKFASTRNLIGIAVITLIFALNLVNAINAIMSLNKPGELYFVIFATIFSLMLLGVVFVKVRKTARNMINKRD